MGNGKFEYMDFAGDRLTVDTSATATRQHVIFTPFSDGVEGGNVVMNHRESVEELRDLLTTWLDETEPKLPTLPGAVIWAFVEANPELGKRRFSRVSGEGWVWLDQDNGAPYRGNELSSFEIKFEGVEDK